MKHAPVSRFWIALCVACLAIAVASAQDMKSTSGAGDTEQQIRSAAQNLADAAIRGEKDAVGNLILDNATWIGSDGKVNGKDGVVSMLPAPITSIDVQQVQSFGQTAIVTGVAHFKEGNESHFLQEWVNTGGQWKLQAHQGVMAGNNTAPASSGTMGTTGTTGAVPKTAHELAHRTVAPALRTPDERAIWKAEDDLMKAYLKGDSASYAKLTADNYVRVTSEGVQNRDEWLQVVAKNRDKAPGNLALYDVQIFVNGDTARVIQETSGKDTGGEQMPPTRFTRIMVKRNGQWQQAAGVFTPIKEQ